MTTTASTAAPLTLAQVTEALQAANAAPFTPSRASGCGRAYVVMTCGKDSLKLVVKACKALGLMYLAKAYGTAGKAIYIGYDNADGKALGKSKVFAAVLNERGLPCYDDAASD